jgi:hypothetical protein
VTEFKLPAPKWRGSRAGGVSPVGKRRAVTEALQRRRILAGNRITIFAIQFDVFEYSKWVPGYIQMCIGSFEIPGSLLSAIGRYISRHKATPSRIFARMFSSFFISYSSCMINLCQSFFNFVLQVSSPIECYPKEVWGGRQLPF